MTITSGSTLSDNLQGTTVAMQNLTDILEGPNPHRSGACGNPECEQGYDKGYSDGQADLISELEELE